MPSPFTWDPTKPAGEDALYLGDDQLRADKATIRDVLRTLVPFGVATTGWRNVQIANVGWLTQNAYYTGSQWNRDDTSVAAEAIRFNGNGSIDFLRAGAGANPITWVVCGTLDTRGFTSPLDPLLVRAVYDHFTYAPTSGDALDPAVWSTSVTGSGVPDLATLGHVLRLQTGTTISNDRTVTSRHRLAATTATPTVRLQWRAQLITPSPWADVQFEMGLTAQGSFAYMIPAAVVRRGTATNTVQFLTRRNDSDLVVETTDNIAVDPAGVHTYAIEVDEAPVARLYIDDVLKATHTTRVSTEAAYPLLYVRTLAAANKELQCDYMRLIGQGV